MARAERFSPAWLSHHLPAGPDRARLPDTRTPQALLLRAAGGVGGEDPSFVAQLLCSARATSPSLANFGSFSFIETDLPISGVGAIILALEGWFHFVFVCIASSLIIVRALRPLQQVAL